MKKSTFLFILLALLSLTTMGQDYLISFAGSGASTSIGTINVDNLTSGASVTLNGGDVLHLYPAVGIENKNNENGALQISPNPMMEHSILTFVSSVNANTDILIIDPNGKIINKITVFLSTGAHNFRISGLSSGMYFVKVSGGSYSCSSKLISQSNQEGEPHIEVVSSLNNIQRMPLKSSTTTVNMPYTNGDQLLYKGTTGIYSTIVTDIPTGSKTTTFNFAACTDADNNNYPIVQIGSQTWMAKNLNVGTKILVSAEQTNNSIIEKYCYNDDVNNCIIYGGLYQWNEMMQYYTNEGVQGICPAGWHLPTDAEWTTLITFLGGGTIAGGKMKEGGTAHWSAPNTGATNSSGFSALPGGFSVDTGSFDALASYAYFWSSSQGGATDNAWGRILFFDYAGVTQYYDYMPNGFSARCLLDN